MLHRGVKFAYVVIMVFSAVMSFLVLRNLDEVTVMGPSSVVWINETQNAANGEQVVQMVGSVAHAQGVNIGRDVSDLREPEIRRHLYLAVGNPQAASTSWLTEGYPYFSRSSHTEVHPYGEIGQVDPRGYYLVFGPQSAGNELLEQFQQLGYQGQVDPFLSASTALSFFGHGALLWCVLVVAMAVVVLVGSSVILGAKAYGVQRLQGRSFLRIFGRDLRQLGMFCGIAVAVVAIAVVGTLAVYNRAHQLGTYTLVALAFFSVFAGLALVTHVAALRLTYRTAILGAVKGEVSAGWTLASSYAIRIPALFLTLTVATAMLVAGQQVIDQQASRAAWEATGDDATLVLSGSTAKGEADRDHDLGQWIRQVETQGGMILAQLESSTTLFLPEDGVSEHEVLVVNNTYLQEHPVTDAAGQRIRGNEAVQVLVPQRYASEAAAVTAGVTGWVSFLIGDRQVPPPTIITQQIQDGQTPFTYGSGLDPIPEALPEDPLVVVIPSTTDVLPDEQYTAYATQGGVIFRDPSTVLAALGEQGFGDYVLGIATVAQKGADQYRDVVRQLRLQVFNFLAALVVLGITAVSVSLVYCRKNAQNLFVKYISGWSFFSTHRNLLVTEAVVAALLIGWAAYHTWDDLNAPTMVAGAPAPPSMQPELPLNGWEPALAVGLAGLSVALVIAALARLSARFITKNSTEA